MIDSRDRANSAVLRFLDIGKRDTGQDLKGIGQRPVFILSTGRTGTQFLAEHFDRESHIHAVHEPIPSRGLRFWTYAYLEGAVDEAMMVAALRRYRSGFFDDISEPIYVESNNFLAGFAEALIEVFDNPALVHVVRDPRTYVRSIINHGAASGLKGVINRFVPHANLRLEQTSDHPVVRRSALYWTLLNGLLKEVGSTYANYHLLTFEDLFEGGSDEFTTLAEIVGADDRRLDGREASRPVNQARRDLVPPWSDWPPAQQKIVMETCGELMAQFGYDE